MTSSDDNLNKLVDLTPMIGEPVFIKTNWKTYSASLEKSPFGGVEFHINNSAHRVQVTTVTGWKYLSYAGYMENPELLFFDRKGVPLDAGNLFKPINKPQQQALLAASGAGMSFNFSKEITNE